LDEAGYYACIENGRTFAGLAGDVGVGTHGGSEDHAAMVCGRPGVISAYAFVPMQHLDTVSLPDDWHIVVASSGVAAEKTGAALESYNRLARGVAVILDLWNRHSEPADSLASALASHPDAERRLRALIQQSSIQDWPAQALEDRLRHFVREDARIPEAMHAFRTCDRAAVAAIAADSQNDSEQLLQNQVDQTVRLTRLASASGAFAARSFGAGFGGSVWAMVAGAIRADEFASRWLDDYISEQPDRNCVAFIATPGPGVVELIDGGQPQE
jgi:galactokinase